MLEKRPDSKILVLVPTTHLKEQWESEVDSCVEVVVINTALKKNYDVHLLIIDEIHAFASTTRKEIFNQITYKWLLGLTATVNRPDMKEEVFLTICPIIDKITLAEALKNKWVSDFVEYNIFIPVDLTEYKKNQATFNKCFAMFDYNLDDMFKGLKDTTYVNDKSLELNIPPNEIRRNAAMGVRAMRARIGFCYDHPAKIALTNFILANTDHTTTKTLTFSQSKETAKKITGAVYHGTLAESTKKKLIAKLTSGEITALNTVKALDLGADIKGINQVIILAGTSSHIQRKQRRGRGIRLEADIESKLVINLVLEGTQDETWNRAATKGESKYIKNVTLRQFISGFDVDVDKTEQHILG